MSAATPGAPATLLEVTGVTVRFGGIHALKDVSLKVEPGELAGLIGPNGAGKTTLFDCITGLRHPDCGEVAFRGRRVDSLPVYRRARLGIGRTFQRMELFAGLTVRDHLLVAERVRRGDGRLWKDVLWRGAPRPEELERVSQVIGELGIDDYADAPIESLSLGQGRLVELGRALVGEPQLLLLDEPSSGLDSRETKAFARILRQSCERRGTAVLLVEHDLDMVHALVGRAYVLDFGRVIASGSLGDVLADTAVRTAYLGDGEP